MSFAVVAQLAAGGVLLLVGAELLVRGASRLALLSGISPLVVGLTVVAFGTSAPELAVTAGAALTGAPDVALGNVVGSNVLNILLVLGLAAVVAPLVVDRQVVRREVPLLVVASIGVLLLALDGDIGRLDGGVLVIGLALFTWLKFREGRSAPSPVPRPSDRSSALLPQFGLAGAGLAMLVLGAQLFVGGATDLARGLGVSELVIGLTVVAIGTSLPELATSLLAALRGERDIAVGNVIGSCIFNLLGVLGLGAVVAPDGIEVPLGALAFDLPVMVAVAVAALPIAATGHRIARWEGVLFVGYYVAYTAYLLLDAAAHPALPAFSVAMTWFVLPLTALTVGVVIVRSRRPAEGVSRGPGEA